VKDWIMAKGIQLLEYLPRRASRTPRRGYQEHHLPTTPPRPSSSFFYQAEECIWIGGNFVEKT
jgi:hypothetical protein